MPTIILLHEYNDVNNADALLALFLHESNVVSLATSV